MLLQHHLNSRGLRLQQPIFLLTGTLVVALLLGWGMLALVILSFLLTKAILPNRSTAVWWPIGLLAAIILAQFLAILLWAVEIRGISTGIATYFYLLIGAMSLIINKIRNSRFEHQNTGVEVQGQHTFTWTSSVLICIATILILRNPEWIINLHMSGGDHSNHVGFVFDFLRLGNNRSFPDPRELLGYPHGIHYLLSTVVAVDQSWSNQSIYFRTYAISGWFEVIQVIAYLQLFVIVVGKRSRFRAVIGASFTAIAIYIYLHIAGAFQHLYVSGFSTALAAAWIMLLPIAFIGSSTRSRSLSSEERTNMLLVILGLFTVYQPTVIPALGSSVLLLMGRIMRIRLLRKRVLLFLPAVIVVFVLSTYFLVDGKSGKAINDLLLDGAVLEPSLRLLIFTTVALCALALLLTVLRVNEQVVVFEMAYVFAYGALLGVISIAIWRMNGSWESTYYLKKLIWLQIFLVVPLFFSYVARCLNSLFVIRSRRHIWVTSIGLALSLILFAQSATFTAKPIEYGDNAWFVDQMSSATSNSMRAVALAYNPADFMSTHVANIALTAFSEVAHEYDLSLFDGFSINELCRYIGLKDKVLVVTTPEGEHLLRESRCSPNHWNILHPTEQ